MKNLTAFVLCGGLGTRLRPLFSNIPKPMAYINGVPFLKFIVQILIDKGISRVVFLAGYLAGDIESYFIKEKLPISIGFSIEDTPLGTGGAVQKAAHEFLYEDNKEVLVVNGDTFFDIDLGSLLSFHHEHSGLVSLALSQVNSSQDYGIVKLASNGLVTSFEEKVDGAGYIYGGYYLANRAYFSLIQEDRFVSAESEIFPSLVKKQQIYGLYQDKDFFDIGTPDRFRSFETWMSKRIEESRL
jgi:D-glycero-alpha-D-manno-heptose 1-phosphate guanylyltransferase